ncbi:hypothetical protein GW835_01935 [archaeon]|nr:hypothetical protein [archaeon]NCP79306.1 hypothetical protein [archaeon]NCP98529.1 hypothetical protein [archaeon]NCQ07073.1 hypothetical protein [archaeon]NCQ50869.1 hypothetical protein [archaeon]
MTYKFNDFKDFVSAVLKDSKILVAGLPIVIGSLTLPAVKAQQLSNYAGLTPSMEKNGVALLSTTITQKDFLFQSFEARYGADFKNKFMEGKYNLGLTVGTNTLLFDKKPTTDKLFEQVNLAANLSKIFGKEINLKIGFDKKLNNYKLEGFNIVEASKGSRAQAALISKKVLGAVSLNFNNGKLTNYSGIGEVNFAADKKKSFTAALGFFSARDTKLKDMYWQVRGTYNIKGDKSLFMPGVGIGYEKGKKYFNFDIIFINKKNKIGILSVVDPSKSSNHSLFLKYARYITPKPKTTVLKKEDKKPRSSLIKKRR